MSSEFIKRKKRKTEECENNTSNGSTSNSSTSSNRQQSQQTNSNHIFPTHPAVSIQPYITLSHHDTDSKNNTKFTAHMELYAYIT